MLWFFCVLLHLEGDEIAILRPDYLEGIVAWLLLIECYGLAVSLSDFELFNLDFVLFRYCDEVWEGMIEAAWVKCQRLVFRSLIVADDRLNDVSNITFPSIVVLPLEIGTFWLEIDCLELI